MMWRGEDGFSSSLRRNSAICVSTVLLTTAAEYPQTSLITCSRETTAPLARKSASSKSNSFGANSTVCDARRTLRLGVSGGGPALH